MDDILLGSVRTVDTEDVFDTSWVEVPLSSIVQPGFPIFARGVGSVEEFAVVTAPHPSNGSGCTCGRVFQPFVPKVAMAWVRGCAPW